ncbi:MAG: S1 RNA-binding domain-containing protein [Candidatus Pacebacteria bacterium]|nr:S1 RNA-binding domain-containing protein [Candidatus Paceibacterota bacterium]
MADKQNETTATEEKKETPVVETKKTSTEAQESKTTKKPQTMDELLAMVGETIIVPKKGQVISGTISAIDKKMMTIDIGAKTEGIVIDKEFDVAVDYIADLKVGEEIDAVVLSPENNRGQILLSLKKAAVDSKWEYFEDALENNTILEVKGVEINKGGLIVECGTMRGFIPSSQFGKQFMGKIKNLKGKSISVLPIEVDKEKNRLIFSERHVSEAKELAQRDQALDNVQTGTNYEGVVSGVMPFGLFVTVEVPVADKKDEFGHVEGLIHISEISWEKVNNPKDYHKVGDRVKVKVLGIDDKTGKLNLSLKQMSDDPWEKIEESYPVGTTFTGTVSRVEAFGIFVNVEAGVDGLIHASKLTPDQTFKKGEEVTVSVESVEPKQRRMSLSVVTTTVPVGYK